MSKKTPVAAAKPTIERIDIDQQLFTLDFCSPVKDKVTLCGPNIVIRPCAPITKLKCLPEIMCSPIVVGPCIPSIRCGPWVEGGGICGPAVEMPGKPIGEVINELSTKIDVLTREVEALRKQAR